MTKNAPETDIEKPAFSLDKGGGKATLVLSGEWTILTLGEVDKGFTSEVRELPADLWVDMNGVTRLDTNGALFIHQTLKDASPEYQARDEHYSGLMERVAKADLSGAAEPPKRPAPIRLVNDVGESIVEESKTAAEMTAFLGEYIVCVLRLFKNPRQLPITSLVYHMEQVGVAAVPIVALLSFLIGMVIAYMGVQQLSMFGLEIFVIKLIELTSLRELGVLMTSIVIAGRSGSSFTAQIGAMVANEEVAAMRTMGLSPMLRLAFPRITALVFMLPALVFMSDIMAILGGGVAAWVTMDMTPGAYATRFQEVVNIENFIVGMVKSPFFAVIIGVVGCYQGFQVTGSAESVGKLTTRSVVEAIFMVILVDALFAMFFAGIGV